MAEDKKNIIWLASYPKSGNTWMRIFLANYLSETTEPVDINHLSHFPIASSRAFFEEATGISSSDLTDDEIDELRQEVYKHLSNNSKEDLYFKIHDKLSENGCFLIPLENTKGVIYLIRNPLDVAVSFANHINKDIDKTIDRMNNSEFAFCDKTDKIYLQLRQKLLSWSGHVQNWTENNKGIPMLTVRYEDMISEPNKTFRDCVDFLKLPYDNEKFNNALKNSEFNKLKHQEQELGFREKPFNQKSFFRKGKVGNWKKELSEELQKIIIANHKIMMKRFLYLDNNEIPIEI